MNLKIFAIFTTMRSTIFHYFSKQFPTIFGINAENNYSPTLKQLLQYVHPDDRHRVKNTVQTALNEKTGYQIEYRLLRKDQTVRYVYEQAEILLDKKGYLDGLIGFIQDITNSKDFRSCIGKRKAVNSDL